MCGFLDRDKNFFTEKSDRDRSDIQLCFTHNKKVIEKTFKNLLHNFCNRKRINKDNEDVWLILLEIFIDDNPSLIHEYMNYKSVQKILAERLKEIDNSK